MVKRRKLRTLIISFILAILVLCILFGVYSTTHSGHDMNYYKKSTTMNVNSQRFDLVHWTFRDPYVSTGIEICINKKRIYSYDIDSEFVKPKVTLIQDEADSKFYEFNSGKADFIIYNVDNKGFKSFDGDTTTININGSEAATVYPVVKKLFMTKRFECIKNYGYFLLLYGDQEAKECLERYSQLNYTDEELNINKNSCYNQSQVRVFADSYLTRYQKSLQSSSKQLSSK